MRRRCWALTSSIRDLSSRSVFSTALANEMALFAVTNASVVIGCGPVGSCCVMWNLTAGGATP
jgi:hypothetical protein